MSNTAADCSLFTPCFIFVAENQKPVHTAYNYSQILYFNTILQSWPTNACLYWAFQNGCRDGRKVTNLKCIQGFIQEEGGVIHQQVHKLYKLLPRAVKTNTHTRVNVLLSSQSWKTRKKDKQTYFIILHASSQYSINWILPGGKN